MRLMPATCRFLCGFYSHKSRKRAVQIAAGDPNASGATILATTFTDPEDLHTWIGGHLEKASHKGVIVWVSRYTRKCSAGGVQWVEEWDPPARFVAYRWLGTDPLVVAMRNAEQERLANDPTRQLPIRQKQMTV